MYITREISGLVGRLSGQFPAIVLTGARQVGKTTLLRELFPNYTFVSLDLPSLAEQAENDPQVFLEAHPAPLVIDEVQYAPKLFRHLKVQIDKNRHCMGQFILTGSQKFVLMKEVSDSLAGRAAILNLENLSARELQFTPNNSWTTILSRGLYPELWRQPDLDRNAFYSSYLAAYLERDVRQILNVHSLRDFERFVRACAARSAQLLNLSELARDVGIKSQTARDWLSVLEASNQVSLLEPYFDNIGKRLVKSPKLYLNDPGMLSYLLAFDEVSLASTPIIGAIWETFIFAEFRKAIANAGSAATLWYYRDAQGREVDFLSYDHGKVDIFECKWTETPDKRWLEQINDVANQMSRGGTREIRKKTLLCTVPNPVTRDGIECVHPANYFSLKRAINGD